MRPLRLSLIAAGLSLLAACAGPDIQPSRPTPSQGPIASGPITLYPVSFNELPGWRDDAAAESLPALRKSCDKIVVMPPSKQLGDGRTGTAGDWTGPCGALRSVAASNDAIRRWAESWLQPYRVTAGGSSEGLFTGYYQAELRGSRQRSAAYPVPLYGRPSGWPADPSKTGQTFATRAEIDAGALNGKAPVVLWLDDPVDAHILHIQGSGRVTLDDGSVVQVNYDGNNGHKFVGLGKILASHNLLAPGESTMPAVRAWLKSHPAQAPALMAENPRYVFFRLHQGEGPVGAQGVALTPGRSLAVDTKYIPLGVPLWLDSADSAGRPLRRLMVAQDTGAAITGPVRGDFFWGFGETAFDSAGRMKSRGSYYLLLPRQRTAPVALDADQRMITLALLDEEMP